MLLLRLSRLKPGRFLEACQLFLVPAREARRLLDADKAFGQTRSGTGKTHTLGQFLPRIRALDGCLSCCLQARLRTLPAGLGKRGKEGLHVEMRRQKRRVRVTLHRPNPTRAHMPALGERFPDVGATPMTILRELGTLRRNFMQGAARTRPRCVSISLETSLGHAVPRCGQTGEARRGRRSFR